MHEHNNEHLMEKLMIATEAMASLEKSCSRLLNDLHSNLAITVELLEEGHADVCLEAAREALENLEKRIDEANAMQASMVVGWDSLEGGL